ncbi:MAG: hypothetical protein RLZZ127_1999 [Planctomycetota bacterium]|jgi:hypothetical protein
MRNIHPTWILAGAMTATGLVCLAAAGLRLGGLL